MLVMQAHGPRLIALTGCMPDLIAPAWEYMRVRAWSMPPILYTLVGMVSKRLICAQLWRIAHILNCVVLNCKSCPSYLDP